MHPGALQIPIFLLSTFLLTPGARVAVEGGCREGRRMAGSERDRRVFREGSREWQRRRDRGWSMEADIHIAGLK